jgi:hypothetical protein
MKIKVLTALWGRPEITHLFALGIQRLKTKFDLSVTATVSTEEDEAIALYHGFKPVFCDNQPLGNKWNEGYRTIKDEDWDALLIMGSDDLISNESLSALINSKKAHVGFNALIFLDSRTGQSVKMQYANARLIGAGRLLLRHACEQVDSLCKFQVINTEENEYLTVKQKMKMTVTRASGEFMQKAKMGRIFESFPTGLWSSDIDKSLDNSLENRFSIFGYPPVTIDFLDGLVDVKSNTNIWKIEDFENRSQPFNFDSLNWLSPAEVSYLSQLRKSTN